MGIFNPPISCGPPLLAGGLGAAFNPLFPPPAGIGHNSLLGSAIASPPVYPWIYVQRRFERCLDNLRLTDDQVSDGETKIQDVVACLNRAYWDTSDGRKNVTLIGSWAKDTRVRPPRDIDFYFVLPVAVYHRFEQRQGNKQTQLLQELRNTLQATYPRTDISGDRNVVVVPFATYKVEVVPAFLRQGGGYLVCDTTGIGRYKHADPASELADLSAADTRFNGNVRKITRLLKQWQRECNVPIKSFHIEAAVKGALPKFSYGGKNEFWFDWLVRDVFAHLLQCKNETFSMPGTGELISVGDAWMSRAENAYARALKACEFEKANEDYQAGAEWQKIFGTEIPIMVG